jgi:short-subunit dehydrogenase
VISFTEALHTELKPSGVRVTALCPGPVPTDFHARAGLDETQLPPLLTCEPEWVAEQGYEALMRGKRVVVPGWSNRLLRRAVQVLPQRLLLAATDAAMQRRKAPPRWPKRA